MIVTVQVHNYCGRGAEYVNRLYAATCHYDDFYCITDDPAGLEPGVRVLEPEPGLTGWWQKLALFKPGKLPDERVVFFDLDTVVLGDIRPLFDYRGEFAMLSDFYKPERPASGVMAFRSGAGIAVWDAYLEIGHEPTSGLGDQWFIAQYVNPDRLQDLFPWIVSWKVHCRHGIPPDARLIAFHGKPRPHDTEIW